MAAITWRNIEAPSFTDAILAGAQAQQSINAGFDSFNKIIDQESKTNIANWDNTKNNNTQEFLNQLNQYRTPEELQAAQASGALDALRQRFGAQIDQAAIRTAEDGRASTLQQRALTGIDYKNKTTEDQLRPLTQQAEILAAKGDSAGLEALYSNNPTLRDFMGGKLTAAAIAGQRAAAEHKWAGNKDARDQTRLESEVATDAARRSLLGAQTREANANAKIGKLPPGFVAANQHIVDNSLWGGGNLNTKDGLANLTSGMKSMGLPEEDQAETLRRFTKYSQENGNTPIPVSLVLQNLASAKSSGVSWLGGASRVENALEQFKTSLQDPTVKDNLDAGLQANANIALSAVGGAAALKDQKTTQKSAKPPPAEAPAPTPVVADKPALFGAKSVRNFPRPTPNPLANPVVEQPGSRTVLDPRNRQTASIYAR